VESSNRRMYHRFSNEFNVRISQETKSGKFEDLIIDNGQALNVSASGILVNVKDALNISTPVRVVFLKPNTFDMFQGNGRIIRMEDNGDKTYSLAIEFIDLSDSEKIKLDYYISLFKD